MTIRNTLTVVCSTAAVLALSAAVVQAGDNEPVQSPYFGQPINAAELERERGRDCSSGCTLGSMTAYSTGNTANVGAIDATNTISGGAFGNSSGAFVAVQNVGNNVIIQTNMAIDVQLIQTPAP